MTDENPYSASDTPMQPPPRMRSRPSDAMVEELQGTRPWVLFLSILGFIGGGFTLLIGVIYGIMFAVMGAAAFTGSDVNAEAAGAVAGVVVFFVVIILLSSAIYLVPSYFLFKYSSAINRLETDGNDAMVEALSHQRKFWKILGVGILLIFVLYILLIVFAIIAGAAGAFMGM